MAQMRADDLVLAMPMLDRLIDDEPDQAADRDLSLADQIERIREGVRRDLEILLNTRRRFLALPPRCAELPMALAGFGMPDVAHESIEDELFRDSFRDMVAQTVARFEPRLRDIEVALGAPRSASDTHLRFRIRATLQVHAGLEPIVFESSLEPLQRLIMVQADS
jgi:type VI secretion system protein ImpF